MTNTDPTAVESIDPDNPCAQRARTECMAVLSEDGDVYTVVGEHGCTYSVDAREGRCTCSNPEYNLETGQACKHEFRTLIATARRSAPVWIDRSALDELLNVHVDDSSRLIASDGGTWIADTAGSADETADERPDKRECSVHPNKGLC